MRQVLGDDLVERVQARQHHTEHRHQRRVPGRQEMRVPESEQVMWSDWDPDAVQNIVDTAALMTAYQRRKGRPPCSVAVIVDDHAEDPRMVRGKQLKILICQY